MCSRRRQDDPHRPSLSVAPYVLQPLLRSTVGDPGDHERRCLRCSLNVQADHQSVALPGVVGQGFDRGREPDHLEKDRSSMSNDGPDRISDLARFRSQAWDAGMFRSNDQPSDPGHHLVVDVGGDERSSHLTGCE